MSLIIGLTGGIASGKTTVANLFNEHFGIDIVDADLVAREVVAIGSAGLSAIKSQYGPDILLQDGSLNRQQLREVIFSNPEEKKWIDNLLHPMIRKEIDLALTQISSPYGLLVVPLLVENNMQAMANRILVIDITVDEQIQRATSRDNVSKEQVESIIHSQASREQRLTIADDVIINSTENGKLLPQVTDLHQKYLAICMGNR